MERRWTKGRGGWAPPSVSPAVSLLPTWDVRIASSQPGWASQETLGLQSKYLGFTGTWGRPRILRESLRVQPTAWQARGEEELGLSWVDTKPKGEKVVVVGPEHFILEGLDHQMRPRPQRMRAPGACGYMLHWGPRTRHPSPKPFSFLCASSRLNPSGFKPREAPTCKSQVELEAHYDLCAPKAPHPFKLCFKTTW